MRKTIHMPVVESPEPEMALLPKAWESTDEVRKQYTSWNTAMQIHSKELWDKAGHIMHTAWKFWGVHGDEVTANYLRDCFHNDFRCSLSSMLKALELLKVRSEHDQEFLNHIRAVFQDVEDGKYDIAPPFPGEERTQNESSSTDQADEGWGRAYLALPI